METILAAITVDDIGIDVLPLDELKRMGMGRPSARAAEEGRSAPAVLDEINGNCR